MGSNLGPSGVKTKCLVGVVHIAAISSKSRINA